MPCVELSHNSFNYNISYFRLLNVIGDLRIGDDDDLPSEFGVEVTLMDH